jgi:hypothetical protein
MAILTKAQLEALNQSSFPDQSTEAITPAILRNYNTQTIDTLVDSLDTGSFTTDAEFNAFTSSTNSSITQLNSATASIQSQLATIGTQSGSWGAGGTSQVTSASFNAYTASTDSSISQLNASSASQQISINALNTNSGSVNSSITQLNASSASQQISINNLNTTTSSLNTSASLALTTASFSGNTLTFTKGNGTTFGVVIPDVSGSTLPSGLLSSSVTNFTDYSASVDSRINAITASGGIPAGTVSSSAQILAYNIFATTGSNTFNGTQTIRATGGTPLIVDHSDASPTQNTLLAFFKSGSAEWSIGNLGTDDSFILYNPTTFQTPISVAQNNSVTLLGSLTASLQQGYAYVGDGSGKTSAVATSSFAGATINTGSFATTGSNVFIGDETFANEGGFGTTLTSFSSSLVFTPKGGFASSSSLQNHLFISASATGQTSITNIIFNTNTQGSPTASIIISGSSNLFAIPGGNQAGFQRRITTGNISLAGGTLPQFTSSMSNVPVVYSNNISLNGSTTVRGPISSSQYVFAGNLLMGNATLGDTTESMISASAGINFQGNHFLATPVFRASKTQLVGSVNATSNLFGQGWTTTLASSSITYTNNSFFGASGAFINAYYAPSALANNQRVEFLNNLVGGQSTQLYTSGSNTTTTFNRQINNNFIGGNFCIVSASANGDNSSLLTNIIYGNNLNVNANSPYSSGVGTVGHGSAFIGRNNDTNGTKANSAETIFAVGTGTGFGTRKTGFLIDSGSNTFVEGTLNVSGSTSFNGAVNITGSLTSSLTQGYVWVGGAGNVSTLVATSSFSGVTSAITASSLITASVNLNTITFTKGDLSTFAITVDTGSGGGGSVPEGTVSSSAQIVAYNKFATTGSNTFKDYQIIQSNLSFQEAAGGGGSDNNIVLSSLNQSTLYIQNTSISSGYNSGSVLQLTTSTGSTGYGSGSAVFQMDALYEGNRSSMKVGTAPGLGSYVQGFADKIEFAKQGGFPNTPATTFRVDATSIELSGSIKVDTGSSGSAGIVSVGSGGSTIYNGLAKSNSIILATTQQLGGSTIYATIVTSKTDGSFYLQHNYGGSLNVAYLIINPIT